jgi:uncharacterized protein (DUF433 family)
MTTLAYPHIEIDPDGQPVIAGANTSVLTIAMDQLAHHWDAVEIQRQRPHLSLGQIHSALAYYYDHELEMNQRIEERLRKEEEILASLPASRLRAKLQAPKRAS